MGTRLDGMLFFDFIEFSGRVSDADRKNRRLVGIFLHKYTGHYVLL